VAGDPAETAAHILAHESFYRSGYASDLLSSVCYLVVTALFYTLFKPVDRGVSRIAACFSIVGIAVGAVSCLFELAPLVILKSVPFERAFTPGQLQELALLSLQIESQALNIGIVFFGFYCLSIGYLIARSTFLPRIFGGGMILAGLGWLTFLYQPLAASLLPYNQAAGGIGEISLTLWLLAFGVNTQRWLEQDAEATKTL